MNITLREFIAIAGFAIVLALLAYESWQNFDVGTALGLSIFLITIINVSLLVEIYRRLMKHQDRTAGETKNRVCSDVDNCYRQLEAFTNLRSELSLKHALPRMRGWAISPDFGELILEKLKETRAGHVLECGCGVSTLIIATYFKNKGQGRVVSLEHDVVYADKWSRRIQGYALGDFVSIVHAPLIEYEIDGTKWKWYDLKSLQPNSVFDFVVIDGPPKTTQSLARYPFFSLAFRYLREGAVVLLDDASRSEERRAIEAWCSEKSVADVVFVQTEKGAAVMRAGVPAFE